MERYGGKGVWLVVLTPKTHLIPGSYESTVLIDGFLLPELPFICGDREV